MNFLKLRISYAYACYQSSHTYPSARCRWTDTENCVKTAAAAAAAPPMKGEYATKVFVDFHLIYLLRSSTPFCCTFVLAKNENILDFTDPKCVHFLNSATLRWTMCSTPLCLLWGTQNNSKYEHISSSTEMLHVHRCEHHIEHTHTHTQLPHTYIYWNVRRRCFPYAIRIFIVSKRNELKPSLHLLVSSTWILCGT